MYNCVMKDKCVNYGFKNKEIFTHPMTSSRFSTTACVREGQVKLLHCPFRTVVEVKDSSISTVPCNTHKENEEEEEEEEEEGSGGVEECSADIPVNTFFMVMCNMKRNRVCPFAITPTMYAGNPEKPCPRSKHYLHATYVCN